MKEPALSGSPRHRAPEVAPRGELATGATRHTPTGAPNDRRRSALILALAVACAGLLIAAPLALFLGGGADGSGSSRDPEGVFHGWNGAWLDPGFPRVFDLQPDLAHIRVPILIVQGDSDPYGTAEQVRLAERECYCPVESLVLPGVGHAPQQEAPEAVLDAVREFVARALAAASEK